MDCDDEIEIIKVIAEFARKSAIEECARRVERLYCGTREPYQFEVLAAIRSLKDKPDV